MPSYLVLIFLLSNFREFRGTVLRGSRAHDGQFPWLIQFHTIAPCGGVLISPDWVLTAAQCVQYKRNSIVLYATGLNGTGTSQAISVKATYIFPQFKGYSNIRDYDNNIALLKLVRSFDMCDGKVRLLDIAPVRLDDDYKSCLIFGWQSTVAPSTKVHAKPIQYSKVLLNSWRVCMYMHEGNASYKNVFCTMIEDENGIRACAGNPGSPVVCEDRYQRMILLGIASWSNFSLDCGGLPTYLGVSVFRSWMWDLIFGSKNMEHWEIGAGSAAAAACQRERHGIQAESNLRLSAIRNGTNDPIDREKFILPEINDSDEDKNAYDMLSWRAAKVKNLLPAQTKRLYGMTKIPELRGKLESNFERIDDYTRITHNHEEPRDLGNFDIVREREERLSQYREIGGGAIDHYRRDDMDNEHIIAVPSQHDKIAYIDDKSMKYHFDRDNAAAAGEDQTESFDVLELVMPDGIEDFNRSSSSDPLFSNQLFTILFAISAVAIASLIS